MIFMIFSAYIDDKKVSAWDCDECDKYFEVGLKNPTIRSAFQEIVKEFLLDPKHSEQKEKWLEVFLRNC